MAYVLPVSDDGGSTAEIVRVLGGPAVGDIRSRCLRLADDSDEEVGGDKWKVWGDGSVWPDAWFGGSVIWGLSDTLDESAKALPSPTLAHDCVTALPRPRR